MSRQKLIHDIASVLGSNLAVVLISLATGVLLARHLGPEGRGAFASLLIIPGMFASIALLGTRQSALYFVGKKKFDDEKIVSSILVTLIFSSLTGGALCVLYFTLFPDSHFSFFLMALAIACIPARLTTIYSGGFFLGKENYRIMVQLKVMPALLNLIFTILFLLVFSLSLEGAILSAFLSYLISDVYALIRIRRICPVKIRIYPDVQKQIFKMGLLYAASMLVMQINYRVDILLLQSLSSLGQIGWYVLAANAAQQLWLFPNAAGLVIRTRTANENVPGDMKPDTDRLLRLSLLICIAGGAFLYLTAPLLLPLIYGNGFTESIPMLRAILPGTLMMVFFKVLNNRFAGIGKPHITLFIFIPVAILNILLNLWLIPLYGGMGAAWASTVSYSAGGITVLFVYSRLTKSSVLRILSFHASDFKLLLDSLKYRKWIKAR